MLRKCADSQINELSEYDLLWLAGFIDGEGTISLVKSKPNLKYGKKTGKQTWYSPRFSIAGTDNILFESIKAMVGTGTHSIYSKNVSGWKPLHVFVVTGLTNLRDILIQIKPYLRLKQKQAGLLLEFVNNRLEAPDHAKHGETTYTERDNMIYIELTNLNKKGTSYEELPDAQIEAKE